MRYSKSSFGVNEYMELHLLQEKIRSDRYRLSLEKNKDNQEQVAKAANALNNQRIHSENLPLLVEIWTLSGLKSMSSSKPKKLRIFLSPEKLRKLWLQT
ncbi:hypothetical protein MHC_00980 [Mycoplasma haemocanis str. Illinois]|uniref:Uncharacterized protein n=1 Tax=Mycoplasma haemocanis (strain Illinois) TaxID=1111676 RepID=H6N5Z0_MYCHN|nr:hypothetical protein [Mycoplasma haemocanis]AEW45062.1 hypothetical protein MHC_00980 [Mycoplasma haemocanis str. Illinois]